jgi:uncharacterized protein (TIGR00251 family)
MINIDLKVIPGSSRNEFASFRDNRLCVRIAAPPEDGKANDSLRSFLAKSLGCSKRDIAIVKGEKSRLKTIAIPEDCIDKLKEITKNLPLK